MNEQTREQTNERASKRREQKFMSEILSKTHEIEENSFFRYNKRLFLQFLENILGIVILNQCAKFCEIYSTA